MGQSLKKKALETKQFTSELMSNGDWVSDGLRDTVG